MGAPDNKRRVLRWNPYLEPDGDDMEFRLTYAGSLLSHRDDKRLAERSLHVHKIRREWHKQLKNLWECHPTLVRIFASNSRKKKEHSTMAPLFKHDGFKWRPIITEQNGLLCALDILILRYGQPGDVVHDLDNRVKTIFDSLRKAKGPHELGSGTSMGQQIPDATETPFYVLIEDDKLITHVSVSTDTLLEPVDGVPRDESARLVITVKIRPYIVHFGSLNYV